MVREQMMKFSPLTVTPNAQNLQLKQPALAIKSGIPINFDDNSSTSNWELKPKSTDPTKQAWNRMKKRNSCNLHLDNLSGFISTEKKEEKTKIAKHILKNEKDYKVH